MFFYFVYELIVSSTKYIRMHILFDNYILRFFMQVFHMLILVLVDFTIFHSDHLQTCVYKSWSSSSSYSVNVHIVVIKKNINNQRKLTILQFYPFVGLNELINLRTKLKTPCISTYTTIFNMIRDIGCPPILYTYKHKIYKIKTHNVILHIMRVRAIFVCNFALRDWTTRIRFVFKKERSNSCASALFKKKQTY